MNQRSMRRPFALLWVMAVIALIASISTSAAQKSLSLESIPWALLFLAFGVVGSLVITRQPRNPVGWMFFVAFCYIFVQTLFETALFVYLDRFQDDAPSLMATLGILELWISELLNVAVWFGLLFFPILYFPSGRLPSPLWRHFVRLFVVLLILWLAFGFLNPELAADTSIEFEHPLAVQAAAMIWGVINTLLIIAVLVPPVLLVLRFRKAHAIERQQIKWPLFSALVGAIGIGWTIVAAAIFGPTNESHPVAQVGLILEVASVISFPVTIGIAILRFRLYDIDIIIRRTLMYAALTAVLAGVYFGSIVLLQTLFQSGTGESPLAIMISTLLIAALFNPMRRRVQDLIDRRFYRQKYDAQQVLNQFAQTARDEVSLEALTAALVRVVEETMRPEQISLWLREVGQE